MFDRDPVLIESAGLFCDKTYDAGLVLLLSREICQYRLSLAWLRQREASSTQMIGKA